MSKIVVDCRRLSPRMMHSRKKYSANIFLSKGRTKKLRTQSKDVRSLDLLRSPSNPPERPSTRRNPSVCPIDRVPITRANSQPNAKPKICASPPPPPSPRASVSDQHKYLQFSLRITEEIIHNDLYDNKDMLQIVRKHYDAHKDVYDKEKLLSAIVELCHELGIPWDETILNSSAMEVARRAAPSGDKGSGVETPTAPYQIYECGCTMVQSVSSTTPFLTMVETPIEVLQGGDAARLPKPAEPVEPNLTNDTDFLVLHDATAKFVCDGDSDASSMLPARQCEQRPKSLVAMHYATSVEPAPVETHDLSVQTMETASATQMNDACTQKSLTATSLTSNAMTQSDGAQHCQHCQCSSDVFLEGSLLVMPQRESVPNMPRSAITLPTMCMSLPPPPPRFTSEASLPDNNLLLSAAERYQRYKKVNDNLSAFYPTIATQVSSMELVPQRDRRSKAAATSADVTTMFIGSHATVRQKDVVALDKYRIDNPSSASVSLASYASGSKRHYQEEVAPDREHPANRTHGARLDDVAVNRRERLSTMDRRLSKLRQGIENRGRDEANDALSAQSDVNRRGEILNMLQHAQNSSASENPSPRHKKLTVFKK